MRVVLLATLLVPFAATAARPVAPAPTPIRTPMQLEAHLHAAGYRNVFDVDLDDGLWEAKVRKSGGFWREVAVDPQTGRIFDGAGSRSVDALNSVSQIVADKGYTMMELAEYDGALWEVDAMDAQGRCMSLRVDATSQFDRAEPARRLLIAHWPVFGRSSKVAWPSWIAQRPRCVPTYIGVFDQSCQKTWTSVGNGSSSLVTIVATVPGLVSSATHVFV